MLDPHSIGKNSHPAPWYPLLSIHTSTFSALQLSKHRSPSKSPCNRSRLYFESTLARCVLSGIGIEVDLASERKTEVLNIGHFRNHQYDQTKHYHRDNNRCPFRRHRRHPLLRPLIPAVTNETAPATHTFA